MTPDIVPRDEWGARAPKTRHTIATPTRELWLHHTAGPERGAVGVREIQRFHMDTRGWSDIAYSFLVDRDGTIYEGRGAGVAGGHTKGHNTTSHAICALGNYDNATPPAPLVAAIAELVAHGHRKGWWPNKLTGGHRDASGASTACPGSNLHALIPEINQRAKALLTGDATPMPTDLDRDKVIELQQLVNEARLNRPLALDGVLGPLTLDDTVAVLHWRKNNHAAVAEALEKTRAQVATLQRRLEQVEADQAAEADPELVRKAAQWDVLVAGGRALLLDTGLAGNGQ